MSFWKTRYNKFGNTKTNIGNKKFDSKAGKAYASKIKKAIKEN